MVDMNRKHTMKNCEMADLFVMYIFYYNLFNGKEFSNPNTSV